MDPATIFGIGQGLAGLLSLFKGKKDEQLNSPELLRLLRLQSGRMYAQNPLAESVAKMAFSRMPTGSRAGLEACHGSMRRGSRLPGVPQSAYEPG